MRSTNSQWYLVNANPDTNHTGANHTNPNGNCSNPNPTNPTYHTTKYRCEFVNLNCIFAKNATCRVTEVIACKPSVNVYCVGLNG